MVGAGEKNERVLRNEKNVVLGLIGVLVKPTGLTVPVASQEVTVGTELTQVSSQLKREGLRYF